MFGFIIGTLCLLALIATLRQRRYRHFMYAYGAPYGAWGGSFGYHHHGHGHHHGHARRFGGHGRGFGMGRALFAHLDTSPGQEKAIAEAVGVLRERQDGVRDEVRAMRKEIAAALAGDTVDSAALEAAFGRGQAVLHDVARDAARALTDVHAALDAEQRKQFADLIADSAAFPGFGRGRW